MSFSFNTQQQEKIQSTLARTDSGVWHLIEDVEMAINAYGHAATQGGARQNSTALQFDGLLAGVGRIRSDLYRVPEITQQLSVLGGVEADGAIELTRLSNIAGDALDELSAKLVEIRAQVCVSHSQLELQERLVHALGQAFRNRLNIKPNGEPEGLFRRFLDTLLDMVKLQYPEIDTFAHSITESRLGQIL